MVDMTRQIDEYYGEPPYRPTKMQLEIWEDNANTFMQSEDFDTDIFTSALDYFGWRISNFSGGNTPSFYWDLFREDEDGNIESLCVRISNHMQVYRGLSDCADSISVAPGDFTFEQLKERISRPFSSNEQ